MTSSKRAGGWIPGWPRSRHVERRRRTSSGSSPFFKSRKNRCGVRWTARTPTHASIRPLPRRRTTARSFNWLRCSPKFSLPAAVRLCRVTNGQRSPSCFINAYLKRLKRTRRKRRGGRWLNMSGRLTGNCWERTARNLRKREVLHDQDSGNKLSRDFSEKPRQENWQRRGHHRFGMGRVGMSNGRYSDSPERNGIPCKYFAFVSPDLAEEELEAECGAKLDIDEADISVVLDDTMVKGVEPWGWHGVRPINEKVQEGGTLLVVTRKEPPDLLKFIGHKPYNYRLALLEGDASLAGLWVYKDDLTYERILGAIAALDPQIISLTAVTDYLWDKTHEEHRVRAANEAYEAVQNRLHMVTPSDGIEWPHEVPVLPKWNEFGEGAT